MARHPLRRWIVIGSGTVVLILAAAVITISTPWFANWVRGAAASQASRFLNGEVEIGQLSGSLLRNVTLRDVTVRMDGRPVIVAESIVARYDAVQLMLGRMSIDDIVVTRPEIHLTERQDGWNLAHLIRARRTTTPAAPAPFVISHLRIVDGQVRVEPRDGPAATWRALGLDTSLLLRGSAGRADINRLDVTDAAVGVPTRVATTLEWSGERVSAAQLRLETPASRVSGTIAYGFGHRTLDVAVDLQPLSIGDIVPYVNVGLAPSVLFTGHVVANGPLSQLATRFTLTSGSARATGDLTITEATGRLPMSGTVSVQDLDLGALSGQASLSSRITAETAFAASFLLRDVTRSSATFDVRAASVAIYGYAARSVHGTGQYDGGVLRFAGSAAAYGATTVTTATMAGLARGQTWRMNLAGTVRQLNVRRLPNVLHAPQIESQLAGRYMVSLGPNRLDARMTFDESRYASATIEAASVAAVMQRGRRIETMFDGRVRHLGSDAIGSPAGQWLIDGELHGQLVIPDHAEPFSLASFNGAVSADVDAEARGIDLGRVLIDASLDTGALEVRRLTAAGGLGAIDASGRLAVADNARVSSAMQFHAGLDDLAHLSVAGVPGVRGALDVTGDISGPVRDLTAKGTFRSYSLAYKDIATSLTLGGDYALTLPDRDVSALKADVDAEGTFVRIKGQDIQRLRAAARYQLRELALTTRIEQVDRSLDLDGSLLLLPEARELQLRSLTLAGAGAPWRLGDDGPATIRYGRDEVIASNVVLRRGNERIDASGRAALTSAAAPSDLTLTIASLNVGDLYAVVFGAPRIAGVADGKVHLTGTLASPIASATLSLVKGTVGTVPVNRATATAEFASGILDVKATIEPVEGAPLAAEGQIPTRAERGDLNLRVQAPSIGLGVVQGFTSHLANAQGQVAVDLHIGGALKTPTLDGTVTLMGAGFDAVPTGVTYKNLQGAVRFDRGRATLDALSLEDSSGHALHVSGSADLRFGETARAFDLHLQADSLNILNNDLGEVAVTIDATLGGEIAAPTIAGRLEVTRGLLEVDELLRVFAGSPASAPAAPEIPVEPAAAIAGVPNDTAIPPPPPRADPPEIALTEPKASTGMFSRASIDLEVVMPDDVVLRGRDLKLSTTSVGLGNINMTIGGSLQLTKSPGSSSVLIGSAQVVRGFYDFQGRRFNVNRGSTVTFRGMTLDPSLDVTGEREVSGIVAQVRVTGTARRPRLTLSSQPPLDEADVLSLIVFNQPANQLGDAERLDLVGRASAMATGALASSLANSIGRVLDVDLFEIRAPSADEAGEVNVGRQVNERLFVGFRQQFGDADASRLSFEYRITEALRLITTVAQGAERTTSGTGNETAGADLVYVIRY